MVENEAEQPEAEAELPTLSDEDISMILSKVPIGNLPACAATCKHWSIVLHGDGMLWSEVFTKRFGGSVDPTEARHACCRSMSTIRSIGMRQPQEPARFSKRAGSAAGTLGGYVIISGGASNGFQFANHIDVWEPATDRTPQGRVVATALMPHGDPLPKRWQHSAVRWGGELLLYGGQDAGRGHPCGLLHVLNVTGGGGGRGNKPKIISMRVPLTRCADDKLAPSVVLPLLNWPCEGPAVTGHSARVMEDAGTSTSFMLSFGGKAPGGLITNLLWRLQLPTRHTLSDLSRAIEWRLLEAAGSAPAPRYCHSAVDISRGWLIFGGWAERRNQAADIGQLNHGTVFLNDLHVLELPAMCWCALAVAGSVPRGRCQSVMTASADEEIVLLFGGACHHDPKPGQAYGDMVMDLYDVVLLHLPTLTWLPQKGLPSNYQQRGGTNTLIRTDRERCFIFGGMNSDEGNDEPNFLNDLTELVGLEAGSSWKARQEAG